MHERDLPKYEIWNKLLIGSKTPELASTCIMKWETQAQNNNIDAGPGFTIILKLGDVTVMFQLVWFFSPHKNTEDWHVIILFIEFFF